MSTRNFLDGPSDGQAETMIVLKLEEEFAGADPAWLSREQLRLMEMESSPRGIRRRNWLRLKAIGYLIRSNEIKRKISHVY